MNAIYWSKKEKKEKKFFPRLFSIAFSCVKHHTWTILTPCCQQSPVQARASEPSVMSVHGPRVASCQKRIRAHATRSLATRPLTTRWSSQFYHQSDHRLYGMIFFKNQASCQEACTCTLLDFIIYPFYGYHYFKEKIKFHVI